MLSFSTAPLALYRDERWNDLEQLIEDDHSVFMNSGDSDIVSTRVIAIKAMLKCETSI